MKLLGSIITATVLLLSAINTTSAQEVVAAGMTWSTKNLDVSTFRNGDAIPEAKTNEEWVKAAEEGTPAWCYYDNDAANGKKYGKLYNFYAVKDERGLAPAGWHIPSYDEWGTLNKAFGGVDFAANKLKAVAGWLDDSGNGTNESGLTVLPGGMRWQDGSFSSEGTQAYIWTSLSEDGETGWYRVIGDLSTSHSDFCPFSYGLSVRCMKD